MGTNYGQLTGAAIGTIMKEIVRRAIEAVVAQRFSFSAQVKQGHDGVMDDLVTTADKAAQAIYVKLLRECFPGFGIIAEEDGLAVPCLLLGVDLYFTVDPLDGTKAFGRRQSTGVGTMLALVCNGEVIAAFIGDVLTGEIFGYRPDSDKTHWIDRFGRARPLGPDPVKSHLEQYVVLRDPIEDHAPVMRELVRPGRMFKSYEIGGGSIGIMFTRLWRGEIGGIVLRPSHETPWDITPVVGISRRLGFEFHEFEGDGTELRVVQMPISTRTEYRGREVIIFHPRSGPLAR